MWSRWCVLLACCVCINARPQRVRFPDQPSRRQSTDDGATIILRDTPQRSSFSRAINPLVNTIPREPLTLADPDQFLNAWQFYFPPGPPPTLAKPAQEDFVAQGSVDLPTASVSETAQIKSDVNIATETPSIVAPIELQPTVTFVSNSNIKPKIEQRIPVPQEVDTKVKVSADLTSNSSEVIVNTDQQVATSNNAPNHVVSSAIAPHVAHVDVTTAKVTITLTPHGKEQKSLSGLPVNPRFEDGGWTPLEVLPE